MKKSNLLKQLRINAIGSLLCSVSITAVQVALLASTGTLALTLDGQVLRILMQMYVGSFTGLFGILYLSSTKKYNP